MGGQLAGISLIIFIIDEKSTKSYIFSARKASNDSRPGLGSKK